jgi:hypothetical protein
MSFVETPLGTPKNKGGQDMGGEIHANAHTFLCRFPSELLALILFHVEPVPEIPRAPSQATPPGSISLQWRMVTVLSICAHVRRVALEHPALWAYIDTRWPARSIDMCLARAHTAPLCLVAEVRDHASLDQTVSLVHRAQSAYISLQLDKQHNYTVVDVQRLLHARMPMLRLMEIHISRFVPEWTLSQGFLDGTCANLRSLYLGRADASDLPELPSMQDLHLVSFVPLRGVQNLVRFFSSMPQLRRLRILNQPAVRERLLSPSTTVTTVIPATVSHLEHLDMEAGLDMVHGVLHALQLPDTLRLLHIKAEQAQSHPCDASTATKIAQIFHRAEEACRRILGVAGEMPISLECDGIAFDPSIDGVSLVLGDETMQDDRIRVSVVGGHFLASEPALHDIFASITFASIFILEEPLDIDRWPVFSDMPRLKHFEVDIAEPPSVYDEVQAWADRRAQCGLPAARVTIQGIDDDPADAVQWDPEKGPLDDVPYERRNQEYGIIRLHHGLM